MNSKKNNEKLVVRTTTVKDVPVILKLIKELAEYEKLSHEVRTTEDNLISSFFGDKNYANALLAEYENKPVGIAIYFNNFSTFVGRPGIYLEDLYVQSEYRGKGIGKSLLEYLINIAKENNFGRVEWAVLDWNEPAINFYKKLGAVPMESWKIFRLTEDKY